MYEIIGHDARAQSFIKPYIGGDDINTSPIQTASRFVIDFGEMSLQEAEQTGELIKIVREKVLPERLKTKDTPDGRNLKSRWWLFFRPKHELYRSIAAQERVLAIAETAPHMGFAIVNSQMVFSHGLKIFTFCSYEPFAILQSRTHEIWARFFSSTLEDRLRYTPSDCFRTFPFPENFETDTTLETAGEAYNAFRANLMIKRNEGLTKIYNRFHARGENAPDIARLRALHAEMDAAVLRTYGWDDLAERAAPEFIEQDADDGKTPKTRLDWPAEFKDEVLARLLALNAERAAAERAAGVTAIHEDEEDDLDEAAVA